VSLFIHLVGFFVAKRLLSTTAWLVLFLVAGVFFAGLIGSMNRQENTADNYTRRLGAVAFSRPVQSVDLGSAHTQVWDATNNDYIQSNAYSGGILLPVRMAAWRLLFVLPLVGLLLAAPSVSRELESGVAQTVRAAPVHPGLLGTARMVGESLAMTALVGLGLAGALAVASLFFPMTLTPGQLARSFVFVLLLGAYASLFVSIGALVSALARRSVRALWICVGLGLTVFAAHLVSENLLIAGHREYPSIPRPPLEVNLFLAGHDYEMLGVLYTKDELEADAGPEVHRYLLELRIHAERFHALIDADYQRERRIALVSPLHLMWELASQLLQEAHRSPTEIFAPLPPDDPPTSLWASLGQALPELGGLAFLWLLFFALNVRTLSGMEV